MWVIDLIIEKQRQKKKTEVLPRPEKKSGLRYLDIAGFLERWKMRRTKERK
jgi:hypothetical protein